MDALESTKGIEIELGTYINVKVILYSYLILMKMNERIIAS